MKWIERSTKTVFAAVVLVGLSFSAVAAQEKDLRDEDIADAVRNTMLYDHSVNASAIKVKANLGVVTLTGKVKDLLTKERAIRLTRRIKGVRSIVDKIEVKPIYKKDSELKSDVEFALLFDSVTDLGELDVQVKGGIVTLEGTADSWAERQVASKVAMGVEGVADVQNLIGVEYPEERPDSEIAEDIRGNLKWDVWVDDALIDVQVEDGKVELGGTVGSLDEKSRAYADAWVVGVTEVEDMDLDINWWARSEKERLTKYTDKSDEEIKKAVKDAFLFDPRVFSFNPDIKVRDGIVTLTGTVDNYAAKKAAKEDAANTMGVWRVKNYLVVSGANFPTDQEIETAIERSFRIDPVVDEEDIGITVLNGTVYLRGNADSRYEKNQAEEIASKMRGVISVDNELAVANYYTHKTDWELKQDVKDELFWSPLVDSNEVNLEVEDGVVTLYGTVDTWTERMAASNNAFDAGALIVNNNLLVENGGGPTNYSNYTAKEDESPWYWPF